MSIWVQYNVTAFGDEKSIGKFFKLDPNNINCIDRFSFSFGQKNIPGLRIDKLIENNPDLIFLVKMSVEFDQEISLQRFDSNTKQHQLVIIQDLDRQGNNLINKKLADLFIESYPELFNKHLNQEKGFEEYRWEYILKDFHTMNDVLSNAVQYDEMIYPVSSLDLDFDNSILE
jgi:hypothetical protein